MFKNFAIILSIFIFGTHESAGAQSASSGGAVEAIVTDPSGAAVSGATVEISNRVTAFSRTAPTDATGTARFSGIPQNPYHMQVTFAGFQTFQQDLQVRSTLPISLKISLQLAQENMSVEVHSESAELIESVPSSHTDIDRELFSKLPQMTVGAGISNTIAMASPGVVKDSDGSFHPLGDHAETSFSIDNQPVSDQQGKQYSNQLPLNVIQSFEVISGAPPAEFGDKGSLIVTAITRSGLGNVKPFGALTANYGSFGTVGENFSFGFGGPRFGNFLAANVARSGRYLDSPEFSPLHDRGNHEEIFDRIDAQSSASDTLHVNLFMARSWFQTPNTYDQQAAGQDQRQLVRSYNIAPGWVHLFNATTAFAFNPFFRQDQVQYRPSRDRLADLPATIAQSRRLSNLGLKSDVSYDNKVHNLKAGVQITHTFLTENFNLGITDPDFNSPLDPTYQPGLAPFDLTRGGRLFNFRGHTDIKQEAFFVQDSIVLGQLTLQGGLRADIYRGLSSASGISPRAGVSYLFKPTATVIRASYSRFFETPYNENLILSGSTGAGGLATGTFGAFGASPLKPGRRNQYSVGIAQGFAKHLVIDASYIWKYTQNAFDFDTLFNTPIAFPIEWRKSKIDGLSVRVNVTNLKGFSAFSMLGHTRARFFGPENGGILFNSPLASSVFRIDHDQAFQQTSHLRYQSKKGGPWIAFTWQYDSGLVAGRVPDRETALALSGDQQAAVGLFCGDVFATVANAITSCGPSQFGVKRLRIPADGTQNDDTNPSRIAPHHIFDAAAGIDNLFHTERPRFTLQFTASNITNEVALYNFLSTFSGTHFLAPRSYQIVVGMVF